MMFGYDGNGHDWAWMAVLMPLMWIALIGVTVWAVMRLTQGPSSQAPAPRPPAHDRETPEEILDRRFASGEIDADTHAAARQQLKEHARR